MRLHDKWNICKICQTDLNDTKESKRQHLNEKHGYAFKNDSGSVVRYFTSDNYLSTV